jgi:hypothetical protein
MGEKDRDTGAALAAHRKGLLFLGGRGVLGDLAGGRCGRGERDLERLGSIMPRNASADSRSSTVARARRSRRCRAAASGIR